MKRVFDIITSFFGLIVLCPIFLVICIIIPFESSGGVFFTQHRIGKGGKVFKLYKFRTMFANSAAKGLITIGGRDPRITRFGYFLRKYKLDELPQLINVLIGDMSIVGPRPEVQKYILLYSEKQLKVLSVKPGITDYASIEFSDENEILGKASDPIRLYETEIMPKKLELNLKYIEEMSFLTDLKIIVRTVSKILFH
jgi:lipopolysaccharide/colanic/teichoic acid biosynthesis glycosyltransferase